ncbi:universal stress protein [Agromyces sp. SYSU T00194]|uniref:universal stress protein n=1 Tax=Agromyces chitinivorans TaxID=3158560 RepID=UPI003392B49D
MTSYVLVGIDGSIASRAAVVWALERARATGAAVALRMIVDDEWGTIGTRMLAELRADAGARAERELEFARARAGGVQVDADISVGSPMLDLAAAAAVAELVAIGTHKTGSFHGFALGSRAPQLAAMSPVPTAVVPTSTGGARSGVVVGVGGTAGEGTVVRFAAREADRLGEPLVVLRADGAPPGLSDRAVERAVRQASAIGVASGVISRRSSPPAGKALANRSGTAVLTVVGRPTAPGARGFRPLGRAGTDLLMNLGGPAVVVPFTATAVRAPATVANDGASG